MIISGFTFFKVVSINYYSSYKWKLSVWLIVNLFLSLILFPTIYLIVLNVKIAKEKTSSYIT
ncbi:hypothetical protein EI74_0161 [Mycoplasma testudineum]|uniref:Uncharacterized protein n=1 Tax=Mycoplasma testudineum TaxID=244584 RepID=A0A4R6IH31_9MOLU|nr:hypothetical protein EI74_0161 [Mycoplasma testudineum]